MGLAEGGKDEGRRLKQQEIKYKKREKVIKKEGEEERKKSMQMEE